MNLSKKIIILSICFSTIFFIFLGFLFLQKINIYEKCLIIKRNNNHILISREKPYFSSKNDKYVLNIHQNKYDDNYYLNKNEVIEQKINGQNLYFCQIDCLKEYYNINEPIFVKTNQTSIFNVFLKK